MSQRRVLSIQSHVVSGYVGNKAATFPLQLLGFDVDPLNTVHFSNHTGFPVFRGERLQGEQLWDIFTGLVENDLVAYSHVLTGYIGSPSFLGTTANLVAHLKARNPDLVYVCDPVMGDHGKLYVAPDLVPLFREKLVPLADIVLPNQFEAEQLTGVKIESLDDAKEAIDRLHGLGVRRVVLTSVFLKDQPGIIHVVGSQQHPQDGTRTQFSIKVPELALSFTGTGDLFAALLLARSHQHNDNLLFACEQVIGSMQNVLKRTHDAYLEELAKIPKEQQDKKTVRRAGELRLIQSKKEIQEPEIVFKAELI